MFQNKLSREYDLYSIKDISLKSDSVLEPDAALKATQSNIGYFLSKASSGEGYGINKNEYSGIGKLKVLDNTGLPIPIARTHHHLKTGLHRNPEPPVSEKAMLNIIKGNVGLFADSISKIGPELFNLSRSHMSKPLPKLAEKQLFPRSIVFELDYTKAVNRKAMLEALEKERALFEQAFEEKKAALLNKEKQKIEKAKLKDRELPTNNKEYEGRKKLEVPKEKLKESEKKNTITLEKKLENEKCTSVCGPCGCVLVRGVCPKCLKTELKVYEAVSQKEKGWKEECKIWPSEKPRYGSSWGEQRKTELLRVSYPFAKEAAAWLYCTIKPLDCSMLNRPSKKRFPERSFSSLNI